MNTTTGKNRTAVLVVDDDPVCRLFCLRALTAAGYRTFAAGSADEAIQTALRVRPQVLVIDIHLPDMSGAAVLSRLLQWWPRTAAFPRFVGVTGDDSTRLRAALLTAGFAAVLSKPLVSATLLACVRNAHHQRLVDAATVVQSQTARNSQAPTAGPATAEPALRRVFCSGLDRQLSRLDRAITSLDWQRCSEILHRLSGAAAVAGYPALASRGRRLLRQLNRPKDSAGLAESYLDLLRQAAELGAIPGHDACSRFRR